MVEDIRILVKGWINMKENKNLIRPRIILITCYKCSYSDESIQKIKDIIIKKKPDKIIVLKIIKNDYDLEILCGNLGFRNLEQFNIAIKNLRKKDIDEVCTRLVDNIKELEKPYDIHYRVGEHISDEIIKETKNINLIHIIMHKPSKTYFDKIIEPSTVDTITKTIGKNKVTILD